MTVTPPVLVVGAGPVGLVAAAELARHGVAVRLIDKLGTPTTESRAIAVHARSLDMLARMGAIDALIATGVEARGMSLYSGDKQLLRVRIDGVDARYPFSLNTPQTETERVLAEHAASLGISVERSVELTQLTQDADSVRMSLRHGDGREEDVTANWVIAADGAHSTIRKLVGGKLEGTFVGERFLLGDVDAEHDLDTEQMYTFFSPAGPLLVMPLLHGRMRIIAHVRDERGRPPTPKPSLAELQQVVNDRVQGITVVHAHWLTSFETHHAQIRQYRWGRVFLTGDTAHVHSPAGGQGMNTGMQDAFNLAWKLAAVIDGEANDGLLNSYHDERHPIAKRMIEQTQMLSRAGTLGGAPQHVRNAMLRVLARVPLFSRAMAAMVAEINIGYRDSPIVARGRLCGANYVAGEHFPHIVDESVSDQLMAAWGTGHTTLTIPHGESSVDPGARGRQVLVSSTGRAVDGFDAVIADPQGMIAARLGLTRGGRIVVRPDTYIGALAALDDHVTIADYFTGIGR